MTATDPDPEDHRLAALHALHEIEDPGSAAIAHALVWLADVLAYGCADLAAAIRGERLS